MKRALVLLGILLSCSLAASAQGPEGVGAGFHSSPKSPTGSSSSFPSRWRFSLGYEYDRINLTGTPFNMTGFNGSASLMFNRWMGVEGQGGFGQGQTGSTTNPPNLTAKSLFIAGGPRLVHRVGRLELWVHALGGLEHFRFSQTAGQLGSNSGLGGLAGGGVDFRISRQVTISGGADAVGTRFFGGYQRHFQGVTSLAFRF